MSLQLENPQHDLEEIITFLQRTFAEQKKTKAVIGVSGGIDSALSLTLLVNALGRENIFPVLIPHHLQPMDDAKLIVEFHQIPTRNIHQFDVKPMVDQVCAALDVKEEDLVRKGNIKARCRMIILFDIAKQLDALVCGTENKSEHYLGYFTRFGDAASDIEPLCHLYKTQVRQLVSQLELPGVFLTKPPSAGLWVGQTDETEMGFTYEQADKVLYELIDLGKTVAEISLEEQGVPAEIVNKVAQQVQNMEFKLHVPYMME